MRQRSRQNLVSVTVPTTYLNYATGEKILSSNAYRVNVVEQDEYMEDVITGDFFHTNVCLHRKARLSGTVPVLIRKILGYQDDAKKMPIVQEAYYFGTAGYGSSQPTVTVNTSHTAAVRDMILGHLNGEVLTPVFFKELPELKSTYAELVKKEFGVKKFANKFLAYNFGILPFLSELKSLKQSYSKIRQHVESVQQAQGSNQLVKKMAVSGDVGGSYLYRRPIGKNTYRYDPLCWEGRAKSHVRGRYFRQYTTADAIRASLDYYGGRILNNVWEAIPYSFVVDWFFSVGDMISYLHPQFQIPCFQVLDSCSIVKAHLNIPYEVWDDVADTAKTICTSELSYFKRVTGAAITPNSLAGPGLSNMRTALGVALIIQKV